MLQINMVPGNKHAPDHIAVPASGDPSCVLERIHVPGTIQPHGAFLAIEANEKARIVAASANVAFKIESDASKSTLLGMSLSHVLGETFTADLLARFQNEGRQGETPWQSVLRLPGSELSFDVSAHATEGVIIVEIEPHSEQRMDDVQTVLYRLQNIISELGNVGDDLDEAGRVIAQGLRVLTGYERTVVYKFDTEWNGQAIAEDKIEDWDNSLAGLRFPASDIPAQARQVYAKSPMRFVPDRDFLPVAIEVESKDRLSPGGIDLTFTLLRSPSPVYLQIHRNLGINGTLSFSIIQNGRLWGLAICHHRRAHYPNSTQRAAALALVSAFALRTSATQYADTDRSRRADSVRMANLLVHMATSGDVAAALTSGETTIVDLFASTGAAILYGQNLSILGAAPPEQDIQALVVWLRKRTGPLNRFQTHNLTDAYPEWSKHAALANGVLAVFLSTDRPDVLLWFRPAEVELVSWGGSLRNGVSGDAFVRPASSSGWAATRHGPARPWDERELEMAGSLPNDIAKIMIRELRTNADISARLRQSQKMEALGLLAGGIAHDFNNIIQSVYGAAMLLKKHRSNETKMHEYVEFIVASAERGTAVTRRLLTFAHQSVLQSEPIKAFSLLSGMHDMLSHTIGTSITIRVEVQAGLPLLMADKGVLETVLVNLASNARDAMPFGGVLTFLATCEQLKEENTPTYLAYLPLGTYVKLSISDTGTGMSPEVLAHALEPFFTTKRIGEGTGLGLAMARGFADQSGGYLHIVSTQGSGTTVSLWFPVHQAIADPIINPLKIETANISARPGSRLLIVDDDPAIRATLGQSMEDKGFVVMTAASGAEAVSLLDEPSEIDLVITDYSMPDMDGVALIQEIHRRNPLLPTILLTGFMAIATELTISGKMSGKFTVLRKPIDDKALVGRIVELLGPVAGPVGMNNLSI